MTAVERLFAKAHTPPSTPRVPGNIDLSQRPIVHNPDGSYSTLFSKSFSTDDGEVLVPGIDDKRQLSDREAFDQYRRTGQHFGVFDEPGQADAYGELLHDALADKYSDVDLTKYDNYRDIPTRQSGDLVSTIIDLLLGR